MKHQIPSRRAFLKAAGASALTAICPQRAARAEDTQSRPNIVLVMADDQGWGDMAYCGHPILQTPNFDAMAAEGLRFDRFYAAAPVCSPTRGSVMTGRHPNRFGCFSWGYTLRPQEITLAEALKSAGYVTGHFGKWHLGSVIEGSPVNPGASGFDEWLSAPNFFDNNPTLSREGKAVETQGESSMVTADAAIDFIRKHKDGSAPFLAVVWFGSPHNPHRASEEDAALYKDEEEAKRHFYGEITGMDRAFGKLRKELRTLGIRDNTILWYCSDNGGLPNVGSTGGREHKGSIYEGGLRVPAIIEWPEHIKGPAVTTVPCNTEDIYPTLLNIAGVAIDNQPPLDGIALTSLIEGKMTERDKPIGFWQYPPPAKRGVPSEQWMQELLKEQQEGKSVADQSRLCLDAGAIQTHYAEDDFMGHAAWLDWPWKLHRIEKVKGRAVWELYNLQDDPGEANDRRLEDADKTDAMKIPLERWMASVIDSLNGKDYE